MGNVKYLMVLAIAAVGLFAVPSMLATYAGTHTVEANAPDTTDGSTSGKALDCRECHGYIDNAAQASNDSTGIYQKHINGANDTTYTTYLGYYGTDMNSDAANISVFSGYDLFFTANVNKSDNKVLPGDRLGHKNGTIDWYVVQDNLGGNTTGRVGNKATDSYGGKAWSGCLFCHRAAFFYGGTHTRVQVRGCTNDWCHGNNATARPDGKSYMADIPGYAASKAAQTGKWLNRSSDAHNKWFNASSQVQDSYINAKTGQPISKDYYTCMGCHTHANVQLSITKSTGYDATLTSVGSGAINAVYVVNTTNTTQLYSYKEGAAFKK
ncbi:hypothetical protein [Candidatus Methanoperedens nitratireducens]|uniref:Cytochrome c-552/4 domain-containing protein n=1 Tax=Candidatus Methanoperedens nitratireducens TaxID=1392998 RepID=A0A284VJE8_9EURY|nr:hypothetical protein [Candidatus Methanoperedens nitroreducens]SNQ59381.1 exported hypothetical protein [Candidatus Methanoperedens nitroreducens]